MKIIETGTFKKHKQDDSTDVTYQDLTILKLNAMCRETDRQRETGELDLLFDGNAEVFLDIPEWGTYNIITESIEDKATEQLGFVNCELI